MHTGMILIYLQNTFDSLDSKILLEKMTCLGFKAPIIRWFESYKSSRKFFVSEDDVFLEAGILNCGIPQGPILGPLLFLIYIKNLPQSLWESGSYSYAHDTCIFNQDTGVHKIEDVLNKELSTLYTNGSLLTSYQLILGKIKQNAFFLRKTNRSSKLNISFGGNMYQVSCCRIFRVLPWL